LPQKFSPVTELLDLQPLPVSVLKNKAFQVRVSLARCGSLLFGALMCLGLPCGGIGTDAVQRRVYAFQRDSNASFHVPL
jgi:hypothetical protein